VFQSRIHTAWQGSKQRQDSPPAVRRDQDIATNCAICEIFPDSVRINSARQGAKGLQSKRDLRNSANLSSPHPTAPASWRNPNASRGTRTRAKQRAPAYGVRELAPAFASPVRRPKLWTRPERDATMLAFSRSESPSRASGLLVFREEKNCTAMHPSFPSLPGFFAGRNCSPSQKNCAFALNSALSGGALSAHGGSIYDQAR